MILKNDCVDRNEKLKLHPSSKRLSICQTALGLLGSIILMMVIGLGTALAEKIPQETLTGKIAFVSNRDGNNEIYTMNTDGSNQQRITTHTGGGWTDGDDNPVWSPNAEKIVFESWRDSINKLFIVNANGTGEARLTSTLTGGADWAPSWSPNGDKIAFESGRTDPVQIYIMNADGSNQTRLTYAKNPYTSSDMNFTYPSWSPDGSKIVCDTHWEHGGPPIDDAGGIYVFSVNTGSYTQLTHSSADYNAVWSPDSSKIAFWRNNSITHDIYVMSANGNGLTKLTQGENPVWSPDGSKIAFISARAGNAYTLYVINNDGTGEKKLMDTGLGVFWTPSWSPDGEKLVLADYGEIYFVNKDGSGLTKITSGAKSVIPAVWSPAQGGNPQIQVTPATLDFGNVPKGKGKQLTVTVKNIGGGTLAGNTTTVSPFSIVSSGSYSLGADQSQVVTLQYLPTSPGTHTGTVVFTGGSSATIPVIGKSPSGLPWLMLLLGN